MLHAAPVANLGIVAAGFPLVALAILFADSRRRMAMPAEIGGNVPVAAPRAEMELSAAVIDLPILRACEVTIKRDANGIVRRRNRRILEKAYDLAEPFGYFPVHIAECPRRRRRPVRLKGMRMLWRGRRQSDNIEDARGQGGGGLPGGFGRSSGPIRIPIGGRAGGGGITGIIILVVLFFALRACGIDPLQILNGVDGTGVPGGGGTVTETSPPASDEMKQFVATVLAETEDAWNGIFQAEGLEYRSRR